MQALVVKRVTGWSRQEFLEVATRDPVRGDVVSKPAQVPDVVELADSQAQALAVVGFFGPHSVLPITLLISVSPGMNDLFQV